MTQRKDEPLDKVCLYCGEILVRKRFTSNEGSDKETVSRLEGYKQFLKRNHCDCYCANMNR